jgi:hypothetical protein
MAWTPWIGVEKACWNCGKFIAMHEYPAIFIAGEGERVPQVCCANAMSIN